MNSAFAHANLQSVALWPRDLRRKLVVQTIVEFGDRFLHRIHFRFPDWWALQNAQTGGPTVANQWNTALDSRKGPNFCEWAIPQRHEEEPSGIEPKREDLRWKFLQIECPETLHW